MRKKNALFVALVITFVIAGNYLFFYDFSEFNREMVVISRVLDGDTVELDDGRVIRMLNINTEEKGRAWSDEARSFLEGFQNKSVELEITGIEKYGRILGRLYSEEYINLEIVRLGLGHVYLAGDDELNEFKDAESEAKRNGLGIWKPSEFSECLNVEINKYDEYVIISNDCGIDFKDWSIKDESTKRYVLKSHEDSEKLVLYSGKGEDKKGEMYWGAAGNVWNNDKDAIFIRDAKGLLAYYDSYGY
ncbi:MAG: thermonuclease family protein [Candidatus Pacearchaeota archaeon]|nr:thermonuclease family protein [Candidatus Pacearchaeota archaeon]